MGDELAGTLRKAIGTLTAQRAHIDRQIAALQAALTAVNGSRPAQTAGTRRPMSAAARRAVGARMKAYWAKRRGAAKRRPTKGDKE